MNCLYKKNKYSNFSYSIDSSSDFDNYTPIINNMSKLSPVKKMKVHKKGKSIDLNFFHKSLIKGKLA